ncbi:MAG: DUF4914 family protein [Candidatus Omnitrophica bacterium]|nr:DUF4914 family protein [Candidatus Omnitrophota bacterium]MBU1524195.1 DUF4914 family protein [Candidatus Omnitrophota bacterium]
MNDLSKLKLPAEVMEILSECPGYVVAGSVAELADLSCRDAKNGWHEVAYDIPDKGRVVEARVCRVRNGIAANYIEPYMRRRDPECMVIADNLPTNKHKFKERFGSDFDGLRKETFEWFKTQELAIYLFAAGSPDKGIDSIVVAPANAGFFAFGLALLQGILDPKNLPKGFSPKAVIYVAPPFRHTHFNGKQVVVHRRSDEMYEMFSYNLYPGPSAKKGVYGMLIDLGEHEQWVAAHCATVQVVTPYENTVTIMHEGASGGGKSEMLEHIHREHDGRLLLGSNLVNGEKRYIILPRTCELRPVNDDMALCHRSLQRGDGKLYIMDAEDAWFVRVNHITEYGTDPHLEGITIKPCKPLLFLNIDAAPGSTALIWEHIEDEPGIPCPNPRVILPRQIVPRVINGPVAVDIRSFGVRTPPCTKEQPTYGIFGLFHVLPPALAWLWRLVAPRGHDNPSIVQTQGMTSEGVGSYGPFLPGRYVDQANLLLRQFIENKRTRYIICPNQNIGAWHVGFKPQWIAREYLARRGEAKFTPEQITPARCSLLGYAMKSMMVEGQTIGEWFLQVDKQPEVGEEVYDKGAEILTQFFHEQLSKFMEPDLMSEGKKIIDCCLNGGTLEDYCSLIETAPIIVEN